MSLPDSATAERQANRLRRDLVETLDQIAENLSPSNLASEALTATRDHIPAWLQAYWAFAKSPAGLVVVGSAVVAGLAGTLSLRSRRGRYRR